MSRNFDIPQRAVETAARAGIRFYVGIIIIFGVATVLLLPVVLK